MGMSSRVFHRFILASLRSTPRASDRDLLFCFPPCRLGILEKEGYEIWSTEDGGEEVNAALALRLPSSKFQSHVPETVYGKRRITSIKMIVGILASPAVAFSISPLIRTHPSFHRTDDLSSDSEKDTDYVFEMLRLRMD